jgi:methylenetetrahydrofolate dehydrogenase (NADP+)/methenyltetrahydrofolate cyclohydrolase
MTARLLDGKELARTMEAEIARDVAAFVGATGVTPRLAAVLVGEDPASARYVRNKERACQRVGIEGMVERLPASTTQGELLALLERLNLSPQVHGILVQLPLPEHIDESVIVDTVLHLKDVDGFSPTSLGLLAAGRPRFLACTPAGIQQLLVRNGIETRGAHVVIVGRSNIVGRPLSLILSSKGPGADATVTVCHSKSRDIGALTRLADIVVMAIGKPRFLKADMVRPGAVVIDVGMNLLPEGGWAGDVDFEAVREVASAITPVPRGVGPMTVTMLLANTLQAARLQQEGPSRDEVIEV